MVAAGQAGALAILAACGCAVAARRRARAAVRTAGWSPEALAGLLWWIAVALALRSVFEPVMVAYYLWPVFAVALIPASRSWPRLAATSAAVIGLTIAAQAPWRDPWSWWVPMITGLALVLWLATSPGPPSLTSSSGPHRLPPVPEGAMRAWPACSGRTMLGPQEHPGGGAHHGRAGRRDPTPGAAGRGHVRAARADRGRVIGVLKTAFVQGMLDKDELGQRVGQTLASRTYAELTAVTADLPTLLVPALPPRAPAPARAPMSKPAKAAIFGAATAILAASVFMGPAMVMWVLVPTCWAPSSPWPRSSPPGTTSAAGVLVNALSTLLRPPP